MCLFRNALPGTSLWWRASRWFFLYCLGFHKGELTTFLLCNSALVDALLKWNFPVFQTWEPYLKKTVLENSLHVQDAMMNFCVWKAQKKLAFLPFCHFLLLPYDIRIFSGSNFSLYFRNTLGMCLSFLTLSPCIIFSWALGMHSFSQQAPLDCATAVSCCVGIRFASQLVIVVIWRW